MLVKMRMFDAARFHSHDFEFRFNAWLGECGIDPKSIFQIDTMECRYRVWYRQ
jgi:hypothetical protein